MGVKKSDIVEIVLIRSGATQSGVEGRYLGKDDEPLVEGEKLRLETRKENHIYPHVSRVYSSSLLRCRETSYLIYKEIPILLVKGFEAFDYGEYQGKTYEELVGDPKYKKGIQSEDLLPIPGGESPYMFHARVSTGFKALVKEVRTTQVEKIAVITHKNVILSLLRRFALPRSVHMETPLDYGGGVVLQYNYDTKGGIILESF